MVAVVLAFTAYALDFSQVGPGLAVTIGVTAVVAYLLSGVRERLGVQGLDGEKMLLELRDRIRTQGQLPALPAGWHATQVLRQAGGSSFGGDFVVSTLRDDQLDIAVVDVSGKGVEAGTRALLLSGAFGGLIGAVPRGEFLEHCNDYLVRIAGGEGFVTAVHLSVDLTTGEYLLASAGHPPAVQFDHTTGAWSPTEAKGVVLGIIPEMSYTPVRGRLRPGDAVMLYTDGLVETPGEDLDAGVDRLLGAAESLSGDGVRTREPSSSSTPSARTRTTTAPSSCFGGPTERPRECGTYVFPVKGLRASESPSLQREDSPAGVHTCHAGRRSAARSDPAAPVRALWTRHESAVAALRSLPTLTAVRRCGVPRSYPTSGRSTPRFR